MLKNIYVKAVTLDASERMKKIAVYILIAASLVLSVGVIQETAFAQGAVAPGLEEDCPEWLCQLFGVSTSAREQARFFLNFFLGFLGFVATAMIIYGGYLYVAAAGNQEKIDQGKKIIIYSAVGILIIFISFAIVNTLMSGAPGGQDNT